MTIKEYKKIILDKLNSELKELGYRRNNNCFYLLRDDLTYFVQFQSSQSSTRSVLKLTFNIEISSTLLLKLADSTIPEKERRHYIRRIGSYFDNFIDKWWFVENESDANNTAIEILNIVKNNVLPSFEKLRTTSDLRSIWQQGNSPGLTERMRREYLNLLDREL